MDEIISDLHIHSTASDGFWSPEEVVLQAKIRGLKQISITDHNTIKGLKKARTIAKREELILVNGVEINSSSYYSGNLFRNHILAYNFNSRKLDLLLRDIKRKNMHMFIEMINVLKNIYMKKNSFESNHHLIKLRENFNLKEINLKNIIKDEYKRKNLLNLTENDLKRLIKERFLAPEIIARFIKNNLLDNPTKITDTYPYTWAREVVFPSFQEVFKLEEDIRFVLSQKEVIESIHLAGGKAILAHPYLEYYLFSDKQKLIYNNFLEELIRFGLDGLEIYFYANNKFSTYEQDEFNKKTASLICSNKLLKTYGSDCHGPKGGDINKIFMGKFGSNKKVLFKT